MLKRLTAFLFIFFIVGQVSAGVCGCLRDEGQPKHSCCKRQKPTVDAMRQKGCCDSDCAMQTSDQLPQERTQAAVKLTLKAVVEPAQGRLENFVPIAVRTAAPSAISFDQLLRYSRPPELYLRHHAFLI